MSDLKEKAQKYLDNKWLLLKRLSETDNRPEGTELSDEENAEDWAAIWASTQVIQRDDPTAYKQFSWRLANQFRKGF